MTKQWKLNTKIFPEWVNIAQDWMYIFFSAQIYTGDENSSINPGVSVNFDGTNEEWRANHIPCPEIIRYTEAECVHKVACKDIPHL